MSTISANVTTLQAQVAALTAALASTDAAAVGANAATDTFWLIMCGALVFFMQCGFALLEAGTVRAKNTKNILLKNLLDACIGALIWWAVGYTIAYDPGSAFIGGTTTAPHAFLGGVVGPNEDSTGGALSLWFFQYVFAAAAATIVSGAMAERTALGGYMIYTTVITMFIYPVVAHWVWSADGWASCFSSAPPYLGGVMDFAGSGVVHMTGGVAALVGAAAVGPRNGRFGSDGKPVPMPGHSTTLQVMGTFILWLGWYGFNPGSTLGLTASNYARDAARSVVTTTLSAAAGGVTVALLEKVLGDKTWNVSAVCNGILAGLVSITAGCSVTYPWAAALIGFLGGLVFFGASNLVLHKLKVDDPLDAFAVHGACGLWGVLAVGLFAVPGYSYQTDARGDADACQGGAFYGCGTALTANFVVALAQVAWVGGMSACMFIPMRMAGLLRVPAEVELAGMDVSKHGGTAYPIGEKEMIKVST